MSMWESPEYKNHNLKFNIDELVFVKNVTVANSSVGKIIKIDVKNNEVFYVISFQVSYNDFIEVRVSGHMIESVYQAE